MTDCIEREAAIEAIKNLYPGIPLVKRNMERWHSENKAYFECESAIEKLPAADVRSVVRGKWIPDYDYTEYDYDGSTPLAEPRKFQDGWQCSLCGEYMPSETNYCPNCGADMRPQPPKEETT